MREKGVREQRCRRTSLWLVKARRSPTHCLHPRGYFDSERSRDSKSAGKRDYVKTCDESKILFDRHVIDGHFVEKDTILDKSSL
eukprot:763078-Hanusia_phi.AAC.3